MKLSHVRLVSLLCFAASVHGANPVDELRKQMDSRAVRLEYQNPRGYLDSLLEALHISPLTQTLVFSKTSAQFRLISPRSPRAIYFNDDVYVGWVRGGPIIEIAAADEEAGAVFYVLPQEPNEKPTILRDQGQCLQCHESGRTDGVPGFLTRSLYTNPDGQPALQLGSIDVDQQTSLAERFGGWFVTGANFEHRGNRVLARREDSTETISLAGVADLHDYLRDDSDVLAHLLLVHQTQTHNRITRAALKAREAIAYRADMGRLFGEVSPETAASVKRRIEKPAEELLEHLLFSGEAALPVPLDARTPLAKEFSQRGPLYELDLQERLLKVPISYLVLSESFDALPKETLEYLQARLQEILSGKDQSGRFAHLSNRDRETILRTLVENRPNLVSDITGSRSAGLVAMRSALSSLD